MRVADFNNLEQGVLDDRNSQARGDVADGGAFLLRLLHAAVHEHGAAAAQINGVFRLDGGLGELGNVQVQATRETLDEAAAARRAGLVEHDVVDHAVLHAQAFHVLPANIQDKLHAGQHLLRAAQVRHGLDLAGIDAQSLQQQMLAVAGDGRMPDGHQRVSRLVAGQLAIQLRHGRLRATEHVALIGNVVAPQKLAVAPDERGLERGGAGIDAQKRLTAIAGQITAAHALGSMALVELGELGIVGEQRGQAHDLRTLHVSEVLQAIKHVVELLGLHRGARRARDGAAAGHEQVGVLRDDAVLLVEVQRLVEAFAQLGQILQRAAQKRDVAADGTPARQAGNGLRHHGLEDGRGDILAARAFVEQRLHVGFGEHAAATGDGIDGLGMLRKLVQAAGVGVEQGRHLVDERTGAAGAGAVHALFDAVVEVNDLRVFAAQLDGDVGFRDERLDRRLAGDDFLHEFDAEPLGKQQAA